VRRSHNGCDCRRREPHVGPREGEENVECGVGVTIPEDGEYPLTVRDEHDYSRGPSDGLLAQLHLISYNDALAFDQVAVCCHGKGLELLFVRTHGWRKYLHFVKPPGDEQGSIGKIGEGCCHHIPIILLSCDCHHQDVAPLPLPCPLDMHTFLRETILVVVWLCLDFVDDGWHSELEHFLVAPCHQDDVPRGVAGKVRTSSPPFGSRKLGGSP